MTARSVDEVGTAIVGYVAWSVDLRQRHGTIRMLALAARHRRSDVGRRLCVHAQSATRVDITGYLIDLGAEAGTGPVV